MVVVSTVGRCGTNGDRAKEQGGDGRRQKPGGSTMHQDTSDAIS